MRIVPIALVIALSPSLALAQSWTATSGATQPTTMAPAAKTTGIGQSPGIAQPSGIAQPKTSIPPAAESGGNHGLRYGVGAADGSPIDVKRNK